MAERIIHRSGWFAMVTPTQQEMIDMLRAYLGPEWWRVPKRKWEDVWRLHRGNMNHVLGMRRFGLRKKQRGSLSGFSVKRAVQVPAGDEPILTDITNATSSVAPNPSRQQYRYFTDGEFEGDTDAGLESSIVYTKITTQTDDSNDHTNEWWPDQPDTDEGLNWDIRYDNVTDTLVSGVGTSVTHLLADNTGTNRTAGTWYLLDTVSDDSADGTHDGGIGYNRPNGSAKNPQVGLHTLTCDVDIRATGSGGPVASHSYDLDVEGT